MNLRRWLIPSLGSWLWLMFFCGLILSTWRLVMISNDGDPCLHLRIGNWMIDHHEVIHYEQFSHTRFNAPLISKEWLSEVIFAAADRVASWNGIVLLAAILIATTLWLLHRQLLAEGNEVLLTTGLVLLAAYACTMHWLARPHLTTHLLTVVFAWLLRDYERDRLSARRLWWTLPPLMLLWTNLHGAFFTGFVLIGIFFLAALWPLNKSKAMTLFGVGTACGLVSLINPNGWNLHLQILQFLRTPALADMTNEFRSPNFHSGSTHGFVLLLLVLAGLLLVAQLPATAEGAASPKADGAQPTTQYHAKLISDFIDEVAPVGTKAQYTFESPSEKRDAIRAATYFLNEFRRHDNSNPMTGKFGHKVIFVPDARAVDRLQDDRVYAEYALHSVTDKRSGTHNERFSHRTKANNVSLIRDVIQDADDFRETDDKLEYTKRVRDGKKPNNEVVLTLHKQGGVAVVDDVQYRYVTHLPERKNWKRPDVSDPSASQSPKPVTQASEVGKQVSQNQGDVKSLGKFVPDRPNAAIARPQLRLSEILMISVWAYFSLHSVRNIPIFALTVTPILACYINDYLKTKKCEAYQRISATATRLEAANDGRGLMLLAIIVMTAIVAVPVSTGKSAIIETEILTNRFPAAAVAFLRDHPQAVTGEMFNDYGWGGYLMLVMPERKVFIDGRNDFYGEQLVEEFNQVNSVKPGWEDVLKKYNVGWTILQPGKPLNQILALEPEWKVAYQDEVAVIYGREIK